MFFAESINTTIRPDGLLEERGMEYKVEVSLSISGLRPFFCPFYMTSHKENCLKDKLLIAN